MCKILDLDLSRIKFLISLDRLCNDSNYFNVGNSILSRSKLSVWFIIIVGRLVI